MYKTRNNLYWITEIPYKILWVQIQEHREAFKFGGMLASKVIITIICEEFLMEDLNFLQNEKKTVI